MHAIETYLVALAHSLPLEIFVFLGSFLEEVVAPVPSPSILVIAGSFGAVQGYTFGGLAALVLLASIGKTVGGLTMYAIAAKLSDVILERFKSYISLTKEDVTRFGARFTGTAHDYLIYTFLRSVPIIPSILLSFGSGAIRLPLKLFVIGTFLGTVIRDSFYISVGYFGTEFLKENLESASYMESIIGLSLFIALAVGIVSLFIRRRRLKKTVVDATEQKEQ